MKSGFGGEDGMESLSILSTRNAISIEFKRTRDRRHLYEARATEVARKQYESILGGLQAIGERRGWEVEQLVFVASTIGRLALTGRRPEIRGRGDGHGDDTLPKKP